MTLLILKEIKERIAGLKRGGSAAQLVLPQEVSAENLLSNEDILLIHNAIHVRIVILF